MRSLGEPSARPDLQLGVFEPQTQFAFNRFRAPHERNFLRGFGR
jgi:hypothetical protein